MWLCTHAWIAQCWAFSATEQIESNYILAGHKAIELSPEQIVACDTTDSGCNGGDTVTAYQYVEGVGLETEAAYPYTSGGGDDDPTCLYDAKDVAVNITSFAYGTTGNNENTMAANLAAMSPFSVCLATGGWQTYVSGILKVRLVKGLVTAVEPQCVVCGDDVWMYVCLSVLMGALRVAVMTLAVYSEVAVRCGANFLHFAAQNGCGGASDVDHCVQTVGYNDAGSEPYWIVRNSWNTDWGIDGYIYVYKGANTCDIAGEVTYVTIKK